MVALLLSDLHCYSFDPLSFFVSYLSLVYYLKLLWSYRGKVMGVDHIVNKQNKYNSYSPKEND